MKQKNTMKLWQMLALAVICFGLILNMFLPLWDITGTKIVDWGMDVAAAEAEKNGVSLSNDELKELIKYVGKGDADSLDEMAEEIDDLIEEGEKKFGINLASMSGFDILMLDLNTLLLENKDYTKEDLKEFERRLEESQLKEVEEARQKIMEGKGALIIEYIRMAIILLFILLGFFLKWNKRIVSVICTAFGFFTMIGYGMVWWGMPSLALEKLAEEAAVPDQVLPYVESLWGAIVGIGTIAGFILGAMLFVMGLVSCFVRRPQESVSSGPVPVPEPGSFPNLDPFPDPNPFPGPGPAPGPSPFPGPGPVPGPALVPTPPPDPVVVPAKAGRVKCTQGVAMRQGYKLPEDRKVIVGKSPQNATLVIHDPHVSNVHCSIRYRAETDTYIIKDHSMNGTFVNGVRLGKDVAVEYPAGTVLSLADGTNKITLG